MDERTLLDAWSEGDSSAAETLVRAYTPSVHRFFRGKVSAGLEDLVQQTFLRCLERRHTFRHESTFRAFILGIARYELLSHYRKRDASAALEPARSSLAELRESPDDVLLAREQKQLLLAALRNIPLEQQIVLELAYWQALTSAEVGEVMEVAASTVRTRLSTARAALARKIRELARDDTLADATTRSFERWAAGVRT